VEARIVLQVSSGAILSLIATILVGIVFLLMLAETVELGEGRDPITNRVRAGCPGLSRNQLRGGGDRGARARPSFLAVASPVPLSVLPLLLLAAICHAAWNALLKESGNPVVLAARAVAWGTGLSFPFVAAAWFLHGRPGLPAAAWALALISAAAELVYFIFLSTAYQRGDLSVVYPLARGSAPVLAVLVGVILFGERLHPFAVVGVLLVLTLGYFVILVDTTIVNVALPTIGKRSPRRLRSDPLGRQLVHPGLRRASHHRRPIG